MRMVLFFFLFFLFCGGRVARFEGYSSRLWSDRQNWDGPMPGATDDVVIAMANCTVGTNPNLTYMEVDQDVTVASVTLLSTSLDGKSAFDCAASMLLKENVTVFASVILAQPSSKVFLRGGSLLTGGSVRFMPGSYLVGSGTVRSTGELSFSSAVLLPGEIRFSRICPFCFPVQSVGYGDLVLDASTVTAQAASFVFKNLGLSEALDQPSRFNPGVFNDRVVITGKLAQQESQVVLMNSTCKIYPPNELVCEPGSWGPAPIMLQFVSINNPLRVLPYENFVRPPLYFVTCPLACSAAGPSIVNPAELGGSGCGQYSQGTLSILLAQCDSTIPLTTTSSATPSSSPTELAAWVIPVAVAVPVTVVVGVMIGLLVYVYQRRASQSFTKSANREIRMQEMS